MKYSIMELLFTIISGKRVRIFFYEGQYILVEELDGMIVDTTGLGKEEVE